MFELKPPSVLIEGALRTLSSLNCNLSIFVAEAVKFWKLFPIDLHKHVHAVFQIPFGAQCLGTKTHSKNYLQKGLEHKGIISIISLSLPKSSETSSVKLLDFSPLVTNSKLSSLIIQTPCRGLVSGPKYATRIYLQHQTSGAIYIDVYGDLLHCHTSDLTHPPNMESLAK